jgi:FKBP-type peptidyl-prolyl cis-trans isomerase
MLTTRHRNHILRAALLTILVGSAMPAGATAATGKAPAPATPPVPAAGESPKSAPIPAEVGSYDVGLMLGTQLAHNGLAKSASVEAIVRGLREGLAGRAMTTAERDATVKYLRDGRDGVAESNRVAAREFLERNARQPGVVALPSGLQYRVLAAGDPAAKSPAPTDQVTVRYRTTLADGTEFDRSDTHDRPATFRVNSVFKGWQEAFRSMKPGAKWQLFVPPELGYGVNTPPGVPPGALLIYELELVRVEPTEAMDPAAARRRIGATPQTTTVTAPAAEAPH